MPICIDVCIYNSDAWTPDQESSKARCLFGTLELQQKALQFQRSLRCVARFSLGAERTFRTSSTLESGSEFSCHHMSPEWIWVRTCWNCSSLYLVEPRTLRAYQPSCSIFLLASWLEAVAIGPKRWAALGCTRLEMNATLRFHSAFLLLGAHEALPLDRTMLLVVFSIDMSHHVTMYWYALNLLESLSSCDTSKPFVQNLFQQVVVWSRSCKASWAREAILHRDWNSEQSRGVFRKKQSCGVFRSSGDFLTCSVAALRKKFWGNSSPCEETPRVSTVWRKGIKIRHISWTLQLCRSERAPPLPRVSQVCHVSQDTVIDAIWITRTPGYNKAHSGLSVEYL